MKATDKKPRHNWRPFEEARAFARNLGLTTSKEWGKWAKSDQRPDDIPYNPMSVYKNKGWTGIGDWLGSGRVANQNRIYRPFEEARSFARGLGLKNSKEWASWYKTDARPKDIPSAPAMVYRDKGWINWGDWLGHGKGHGKANKKIFVSSQ